MIPPSGPERLAALAALEETARGYTHIDLHSADVDDEADLLEFFLLHPDAASSVTLFSICIDLKRYRSTDAIPVSDGNRTWEQHASYAGDYVLLEQCLLNLKLSEDARAAGFRAIREQMPQAGPMPGEGAIPQFRIRRHEAVAILLLWVCTNVETLRLAKEYPLHMHLEQYFNLVNYGRLPGLGNVKRVEFFTPGAEAEDDRFYDAFQFAISLQGIHRLPRLESVLMEAVCTPENYDYDKFAPRCGNMKRLEFSHVDLDYSVFATLVAIPKELEELQISLGGLMSYVGGNPEWLPQYVQRVLLCHKNTLKSLDIDTETAAMSHKGRFSEDDYQSPQLRREDKVPIYREFLDEDLKVSEQYHHQTPTRPVEIEHTEPVYASFADFKVLKHLRIGIYSLLGLAQGPGGEKTLPDFGVNLVDVLPPSLESLALYGYERGDCKDVDKQVDDFLHRKEAMFPLLIEVEGIESKIESIRDRHGYEPDDDNVWDRGEGEPEEEDDDEEDEE